MNTESMSTQIQPIGNAAEKFFDLVSAWKKAKEDDKVTFLESIGMIKEVIEFISAVKQVKSVNMINATDEDIQDLSMIFMKTIEREVKFVREDLVNMLEIARSGAQMIARVR
jgi:hypothetical protein